jgi:multiple sugar transport system ATP-binding protein
MATVTLDHVSKAYRDVVAIRDVSLDIADGEFLAVVGPSGCGKTTLLRLIAGLEVPDRGTILIDGTVVNDVAPNARNVAMVFEDRALYPNLVVRENLGFPLRIHRTPAAEIRRRVSEVAHSMDLDRLLERRPHGLAAGEAQHVAVGRALVREDPAVFLLDDALAHLDARQRHEARAELGRLHRELRTTIVSVTHDQAEALALGDRVAVLDAGALRQTGPPRALYDHPANVFVAGFIGSPPMNLVEMTLERDSERPILRSGELTLPAPAWIVDRASGEVAGAVTVGIRPEHLRIGGPTGDFDATVRGRSDLVEFLGHHVLVHVRVGELELRVFDAGAGHHRVGDIVDVTIPLDRLHLFDGRTGQSLGGISP